MPQLLLVAFCVLGLSLHTCLTIQSLTEVEYDVLSCLVLPLTHQEKDMEKIERNNAGRIWIPHISEKQLQELAKRIRPLLRFAEGADGLFLSPHGFLYYIKTVSIDKRSYLHQPHPDCRAGGFSKLGTIKTYHAYSNHLFFSPSIAEVLTFIFNKKKENVIAFEIIEGPQTMDEPEAFEAGYHTALVQLYGRA